MRRPPGLPRPGHREPPTVPDEGRPVVRGDRYGLEQVGDRRQRNLHLALRRPAGWHALVVSQVVPIVAPPSICLAHLQGPVRVGEENLDFQLIVDAVRWYQ